MTLDQMEFLDYWMYDQGGLITIGSRSVEEIDVRPAHSADSNQVFFDGVIDGENLIDIGWNSVRCWEYCEEEDGDYFPEDLREYSKLLTDTDQRYLEYKQLGWDNPNLKEVRLVMLGEQRCVEFDSEQLGLWNLINLSDIYRRDGMCSIVFRALSSAEKDRKMQDRLNRQLANQIKLSSKVDTVTASPV